MCVHLLKHKIISHLHKYLVLSSSTFGSNYSLGSFLGMTQQALHTCIGGVSAILLCKSSQAQSYWMGTTSGQPFSGLSRNVRQGSSQGSGWATLGHSQSCPEAAPVLPWLCLGSLSCWKVNLLPSLRFRMFWTRFSLRHPQYFGTLRFSSTLMSTSFMVINQWNTTLFFNQKNKSFECSQLVTTS